MEFVSVNWLAVIVGTALAFGLRMIWFSPMLFGKGWAAGSHGITAPANFPVAAVLVQLAGTFLMVSVIGMTETTGALLTAIAAILAMDTLQLAAAMFGQKSRYAALVDAGFVLAMGVMIVGAQAVF